MFGDYTKLLLEDYEKKRAADLLPLNLSDPTPARLRDECLIAFEKRFKRKDEKTLRDFFGPPADHSSYARVIKNYDIGKFKALINFIKKPTINTDEKNIELLALLIDFEKRPYDDRIDYTRPENIIEPPVKEDGNTPMTSTENPGSSNKTKAHWEVIDNKKEPAIETGKLDQSENNFLTTTKIVTKSNVGFKRWYTTIAIIIAVTAGTIYWMGTNKTVDDLPMSTSFSKNKECMYWADDHYEAIPCGQKVDDALVMALDTTKLRRFKKITRPDTITQNDIGRVWYAKNKNQIELFTIEGYHPVNIKQRLRPLSQLIFDKYIVPVK